GRHTVLPPVTFAEMSRGTYLRSNLSLKYLRDAGIYIYETTEGEARIAVSDEGQLPLLETIVWTLQRDLIAELATAEDIAAALDRIETNESPSIHVSGSVQSSSNPEADEGTVDALRDLASGAPVVRAVNDIIERALERRATDIHLEPMRRGFRVRIRVD